jgi:hypothetical protein
VRHLKRIVLCVVLSVAASHFAWTRPLGADDWQPIDPTDLTLKDNPQNPGADAMVLYHETRINEPLRYTDDYVRLKVFTKEGIKYADVEVPYDKGQETITEIRGRTVHADGTVVNFDGKTLDRVEVKGGESRFTSRAFPFLTYSRDRSSSIAIVIGSTGSTTSDRGAGRRRENCLRGSCASRSCR